MKRLFFLMKKKDFHIKLKYLYGVPKTSKSEK